VTATDHARVLAVVSANAAREKQASEVMAMDVSDHLSITDIFLLATANNERQVKSISDEIERQLLALGERPVRREGEQQGRWILLDYVDIVVHVQHSDERHFYSLDRLWKDCPVVELPIEPLPVTGQ
jgi:ribosome-associated protein